MKVFTAADPEPDVLPGTLAVVHVGDYQRQEVWVASGSNIGNWYPLGGEHWVVWARAALPPAVLKEHPVWRDVVARGPVVLMVAVGGSGYEQGWVDGRAQLLEQIQQLAEA